MIWSIVLELLALAPLFVLVVVVSLKRKQLDNDDRRDPITTELRSLPGHSLQAQLDKLSESSTEKLLIALIAGPLVALLLAMRRLDMSSHPWGLFDTFFVIASVMTAFYLGWQVTRNMPFQRKIRQGIRAEHATAQELASALAGNNRIINDVQAKGFNIDHVVITPAGVFAVETKSRLKPRTDNGLEYKVRYDGKQLEFPGWTETKPIEQAARQAKWLSDYLKQTTGESFPVIPVLALPGWFVESSVWVTDNMVRVINPKNSAWLLVSEKLPARLEKAAIQRAAAALERLAQVDAA